LRAASLVACAARSQILRLHRSTSDGLQAAPAYAHRKPIDVSLTIWKRPVLRSAEASILYSFITYPSLSFAELSI
jgi:hypothetical protein